MKRSEMIDKMVSYFDSINGPKPLHKRTAIQLLAILEREGMLPPEQKIGEMLIKKYPEYFEDDGYHGIVCKYSHWDYAKLLPKELHKHVKVQNCGDYSMVVVNDGFIAWEDEDE